MMWKIKHGHGLVAARWQLVNAKVDDTSLHSSPCTSSWMSPQRGESLRTLRTSKVAGLHFLSLLHILPWLCLFLEILLISEFGYWKSWRWWFLNPPCTNCTLPCFWCSRSSSGIGLGASVNAQWRTGLPSGRWTYPRTACRWSRSWQSSHCWGWWETGAGSHSLPWWKSPNCRSRDSRYNRTTLVVRQRLRLEWFIFEIEIKCKHDVKDKAWTWFGRSTMAAGKCRGGWWPALRIWKVPLLVSLAASILEL